MFKNVICFLIVTASAVAQEEEYTFEDGFDPSPLASILNARFPVLSALLGRGGGPPHLSPFYPSAYPPVPIYVPMPVPESYPWWDKFFPCKHKKKDKHKKPYLKGDEELEEQEEETEEEEHPVHEEYPAYPPYHPQYPPYPLPPPPPYYPPTTTTTTEKTTTTTTTEAPTTTKKTTTTIKPHPTTEENHPTHYPHPPQEHYPHPPEGNYPHPPPEHYPHPPQEHYPHPPQEHYPHPPPEHYPHPPDYHKPGYHPSYPIPYPPTTSTTTTTAKPKPKPTKPLWWTIIFSTPKPATKQTDTKRKLEQTQQFIAQADSRDVDEQKSDATVPELPESEYEEDYSEPTEKPAPEDP